MLPAKPNWFPDWAGLAALIVAGGPSVHLVDLGAARHVPSLKWAAVNNSYRLIPWADLLFACDRAWWQASGGARSFHGLRVSHDAQVASKYPGVKHIVCRKSVNTMLVGSPWEIGWGSNGGFQAINLALQFGCRKIVLVGFDMNIDNGLHWHGPHVKGLNNPKPESVKRWRRILDAQRPFLDSIGAELVIGSPRSSLTAYRTMEFREALAWAAGS